MIKNKIGQTVAIEAPIFESLLSRRVVQSFGFARSGSRMQSHMNNLIHSMNLKVEIQGGDKVYWNNGQIPSEYMGLRSNGEGDAKRDIREVPIQELQNAICFVLFEQVDLSNNDLIREAAKLLNYIRMGTNVIASFENAIYCCKIASFLEKTSNGCWTLTDIGMHRAKKVEEWL